MINSKKNKFKQIIILSIILFLIIGTLSVIKNNTCMGLSLITEKELKKYNEISDLSNISLYFNDEKLL